MRRIETVRERRSPHRAVPGALFAIVFASCGGGATPAPTEYPRMPSAQRPNAGREVVRAPLREEPLQIAQRGSSPLVTLRVVFEAGSATDGDRGGLTMLTARTMVEGAAGELSYAERSRRLYPMAGVIDVHVGRDQTAFVGQVHRDHAEGFYVLFRDVLLRPRLASDDFERVRQQMQTALSIDLRSAQDEELGKEALQSAIYAGHPYGHPPLGTIAGLARIRADDLRAHRSRVFCGGRALIGIAGDYPRDLEQRLSRDVGSLTSAACEGQEALPPVGLPDAPRVTIVHKPDAQAVAISIGHPIDVRRDHPDYPALVLASAYLGQHRQFVGRLMQAIRGQRGLNYGDFAYTEHFTQEAWTRFPVANDARRQQYFSLWLRPLRPETAHFALRLAIREFALLAQNGLTQEQLDGIRSFADRYFALLLQTASRRLGYAIDDAYYGAEAPYLSRLREAWAGLSVDEFNAAVRRHLRPEALTIAIVASDAEELANAIATEAASPITYRTPVPAAVQDEDRAIVGYRLGIPRERITLVPVDQMFAR